MPWGREDVQTQLHSQLGRRVALPSRAKEEVKSRLTLLTPEPAEAGVALAGVVVDGLHTFPVAAAGRVGTGRCGKGSSQ